MSAVVAIVPGVAGHPRELGRLPGLAAGLPRSASAPTPSPAAAAFAYGVLGMYNARLVGVCAAVGGALGAGIGGVRGIARHDVARTALVYGAAGAALGGAVGPLAAVLVLRPGK